MGVLSRRWLPRILTGLGAALLILVALGFVYEEIGRRQDSQHPFRIGRAVDIGGRSLNIDCAGSGTPAVILEAGGGGYGGYGWKAVQDGVAQFTTVCWYDRAGEGWSDPAPTARSSATIVHDLHGCCSAHPSRVRTYWSVIPLVANACACSPRRFRLKSPAWCSLTPAIPTNVSRPCCFRRSTSSQPSLADCYVPQCHSSNDSESCE